MQRTQRAEAALLLVTVAVLTTVVPGCRLATSPPMTGAIGAATVGELLERYKAAHRAKDIKLLRPLLLINADWLARRGEKKDLDAAMLESARINSCGLTWIRAQGRAVESWRNRCGTTSPAHPPAEKPSRWAGASHPTGRVTIRTGPASPFQKEATTECSDTFTAKSF